MKKKSTHTKQWKGFWKIGKKELNTHIFDINDDEELVVREGNYQYNVHELVRKFGSSLEVFLPFVLEERLNGLFTIFGEKIKQAGYRGKFFYHYPMKVNQNKETVLTLVSEGAHLEVGSANELTLVKKLWESASVNNKIRVLCNGPKTKTYVDLIFRMWDDHLSIVPIIEDKEELNLFKEFRGDIGIRVNLQTKVRSHWDKKVDRFGLSAEEIFELGRVRNLKILHYHIGSQVERGADIIAVLKEAFFVYKKLRHSEKSGTVAVAIVIFEPARKCFSASFFIVFGVIRGWSAYSTITFSASPQAVLSARTACPVPSCSSCTAY